MVADLRIDKGLYKFLVSICQLSIPMVLLFFQGCDDDLVELSAETSAVGEDMIWQWVDQRRQHICALNIVRENVNTRDELSFIFEILSKKKSG